MCIRDRYCRCANASDCRRFAVVRNCQPQWSRDFRRVQDTPDPVSYTHLDVYKRQRVTYASLGVAPYRYFVVTWSQMREWNSGTSLFNVQMILYENGDFVYQYKDCLLYTSRCV